MNEILERLKTLNLEIENVFPIKGGELNDTFRIESYDKKYFLKLNTAQNFPSLFEKEANSLEIIAQTKLFNTPEIIKYGTTDNDFQFLILEWLERGEPFTENWQQLGQRMAQFHQHTNDQFGWKEDNYIAILIQPNQPKAKWVDFYTENRIMPMVKLLFDKEMLSTKEVQSAEKLCADLINIFPEEKPALIHGDFWNGNIFAREDGDITLIDPAIHYGNREMDIAMADLFGGFDEAFFNAYNEVFPLQENFEDRKSFAQLYPLLIHAFLFEGYYIKDVKSILKRYNYTLS